MQHIIPLICLCLALAACGANTPAKPTSQPTESASKPSKTTQSSQQNIAYAERIGAALYHTINSTDATDAYTSRESDLVRMSKDLRCEGEYQAVSVADEQGSTENIYLILNTPTSDGFQIGRHIRFRFTLGTNDIIDVATSSKGCMLIPTHEEGIAYVTHIISNEPTEFHVFLSLLHQKPIYVSTSTGTWIVANGKIKLVEK